MIKELKSQNKKKQYLKKSLKNKNLNDDVMKIYK